MGLQNHVLVVPARVWLVVLVVFLLLLLESRGGERAAAQATRSSRDEQCVDQRPFTPCQWSSCVLGVCLSSKCKPVRAAPVGQLCHSTRTGFGYCSSGTICVSHVYETPVAGLPASMRLQHTAAAQANQSTPSWSCPGPHTREGGTGSNSRPIPVQATSLAVSPGARLMFRSNTLTNLGSQLGGARGRQRAAADIALSLGDAVVSRATPAQAKQLSEQAATAHLFPAPRVLRLVDASLRSRTSSKTSATLAFSALTSPTAFQRNTTAAATAQLCLTSQRPTTSPSCLQASCSVEAAGPLLDGLLSFSSAGVMHAPEPRLDCVLTLEDDDGASNEGATDTFCQHLMDSVASSLPHARVRFTTLQAPTQAAAAEAVTSVEAPQLLDMSPVRRWCRQRQSERSALLHESDTPIILAVTERLSARATAAAAGGTQGDTTGPAREERGGTATAAGSSNEIGFTSSLSQLLTAVTLSDAALRALAGGGTYLVQLNATGGCWASHETGEPRAQCAPSSACSIAPFFSSAHNTTAWLFLTEEQREVETWSLSSSSAAFLGLADAIAVSDEAVCRRSVSLHLSAATPSTALRLLIPPRARSTTQRPHAVQVRVSAEAQDLAPGSSSIAVAHITGADALSDNVLLRPDPTAAASAAASAGPGREKGPTAPTVSRPLLLFPHTSTSAAAMSACIATCPPEILHLASHATTNITSTGAATGVADTLIIALRAVVWWDAHSHILAYSHLRARWYEAGGGARHPALDTHLHLYGDKAVPLQCSVTACPQQGDGAPCNTTQASSSRECLRIHVPSSFSGSISVTMQPDTGHPAANSSGVGRGPCMRVSQSAEFHHTITTTATTRTTVTQLQHVALRVNLPNATLISAGGDGNSTTTPVTMTSAVVRPIRLASAATHVLLWPAIPFSVEAAARPFSGQDFASNNSNHSASSSARVITEDVLSRLRVVPKGAVTLSRRRVPSGGAWAPVLVVNANASHLAARNSSLTVRVWLPSTGGGSAAAAASLVLRLDASQVMQPLQVSTLVVPAGAQSGAAFQLCTLTNAGKECDIDQNTMSLPAVQAHINVASTTLQPDSTYLLVAFVRLASGAIQFLPAHHFHVTASVVPTGQSAGILSNAATHSQPLTATPLRFWNNASATARIWLRIHAHSSMVLNHTPLRASSSPPPPSSSNSLGSAPSVLVAARTFYVSPSSASTPQGDASSGSGLHPTSSDDTLFGHSARLVVEPSPIVFVPHSPAWAELGRRLDVRQHTCVELKLQPASNETGVAPSALPRISLTGVTGKCAAAVDVVKARTPSHSAGTEAKRTFSFAVAVVRANASCAGVATLHFALDAAEGGATLTAVNVTCARIDIAPHVASSWNATRPTARQWQEQQEGKEGDVLLAGLKSRSLAAWPVFALPGTVTFRLSPLLLRVLACVLASGSSGSTSNEAPALMAVNACVVLPSASVHVRLQSALSMSVHSTTPSISSPGHWLLTQQTGALADVPAHKRSVTVHVQVVATTPMVIGHVGDTQDEAAREARPSARVTLPAETASQQQQQQQSMQGVAQVRDMVQLTPCNGVSSRNEEATPPVVIAGRVGVPQRLLLPDVAVTFSNGARATGPLSVLAPALGLALRSLTAHDQKYALVDSYERTATVRHSPSIGGHLYPPVALAVVAARELLTPTPPTRDATFLVLPLVIIPPHRFLTPRWLDPQTLGPWTSGVSPAAHTAYAQGTSPSSRGRAYHGGVPTATTAAVLRDNSSAPLPLLLSMDQPSLAAAGAVFSVDVSFDPALLQLHEAIVGDSFTSSIGQHGTSLRHLWWCEKEAAEGVSVTRTQELATCNRAGRVRVMLVVGQRPHARVVQLLQASFEPTDMARASAGADVARTTVWAKVTLDVIPPTVSDMAEDTAAVNQLQRYELPPAAVPVGISDSGSTVPYRTRRRRTANRRVAQSVRARGDRTRRNYGSMSYTFAGGSRCLLDVQEDASHGSGRMRCLRDAVDVAVALCSHFHPLRAGRVCLPASSSAVESPFVMSLRATDGWLPLLLQGRETAPSLSFVGQITDAVVQQSPVLVGVELVQAGEGQFAASELQCADNRSATHLVLITTTPLSQDRTANTHLFVRLASSPVGALGADSVDDFVLFTAKGLVARAHTRRHTPGPSTSYAGTSQLQQHQVCLRLPATGALGAPRALQAAVLLVQEAGAISPVIPITWTSIPLPSRNAHQGVGVITLPLSSTGSGGSAGAGGTITLAAPASSLPLALPAVSPILLLSVSNNGGPRDSPVSSIVQQLVTPADKDSGASASGAVSPEADAPVSSVNPFRLGQSHVVLNATTSTTAFTTMALGAGDAVRAVGMWGRLSAPSVSYSSAPLLDTLHRSNGARLWHSDAGDDPGSEDAVRALALADFSGSCISPDATVWDTAARLLVDITNRKLLYVEAARRVSQGKGDTTNSGNSSKGRSSGSSNMPSLFDNIVVDEGNPTRHVSVSLRFNMSDAQHVWALWFHTAVTVSPDFVAGFWLDGVLVDRAPSLFAHVCTHALVPPLERVGGAGVPSALPLHLLVASAVTLRHYTPVSSGAAQDADNRTLSSSPSGVLLPWCSLCGRNWTSFQQVEVLLRVSGPRGCAALHEDHLGTSLLSLASNATAVPLHNVGLTSLSCAGKPAVVSAVLFVIFPDEYSSASGDNMLAALCSELEARPLQDLPLACSRAMTAAASTISVPTPPPPSIPTSTPETTPNSTTVNATTRRPPDFAGSAGNTRLTWVALVLILLLALLIFVAILLFCTRRKKKTRLVMPAVELVRRPPTPTKPPPPPPGPHTEILCARNGVELPVIVSPVQYRRAAHMSQRRTPGQVSAHDQNVFVYGDAGRGSFLGMRSPANASVSLHDSSGFALSPTSPRDTRLIDVRVSSTAGASLPGTPTSPQPQSTPQSTSKPSHSTLEKYQDHCLQPDDRTIIIARRPSHHRQHQQHGANADLQSRRPPRRLTPLRLQQHNQQYASETFA